MRILLLQDRSELVEKIRFLIESTYGGQVDEASLISDGAAAFKSAKPPIDLILFDLKHTVEELAEFCKVCAPVPVLLCAQAGPKGLTLPSNVLGVIERSVFVEGAIQAINDLVAKGAVQSKPSDDVGQVRIRTKLLLSVCPLKGDIYIRLSQNKFVKLFKQGDVFDLNDLEKYTLKKGVEYLYIRKEQCAEFAVKYKDELQKVLKLEHLTLDEAGRLGDATFEAVQELTKQVGFTKEVQEVTRMQVQLTVKAMGKDPDLAELLAKLRASEGKYISSHSTLCGYLACAIAAQMQWGSDTTFQKLTLASFLHDITLENQELAALTSIEELEKGLSKFTAQEIKDFKEHPAAGAEMAKKMTEVPPDVDVIIRQHHERPDGTGFPRGLNHTYIAPLASVFIVAHDLAKNMLEAGDKFDIQAFLDGVREKYKSSQFKRLLSCLENIQKIKKMSSMINKKKEDPPAS